MILSGLDHRGGCDGDVDVGAVGPDLGSLFAVVAPAQHVVARRQVSGEEHRVRDQPGRPVAAALALEAQVGAPILWALVLETLLGPWPPRHSGTLDPEALLAPGSTWVHPGPEPGGFLFQEQVENRTCEQGQ